MSRERSYLHNEYKSNGPYPIIERSGKSTN